MSAKKKKKKWIIPVAIVAAVILIFVAVAPQFAAPAALADIKTVKVERGTINTTVVGSGTLAANETLELNIPASLSVENVLVEPGDVVQAGDALATLNPTELQAAILNTASEIQSLDNQIQELLNESAQDTISASVAGRVKEIYAREGDNTTDVIQKHGCLALLSIDGTMKLSIETSALAAGDTVSVEIADGSKKEGRVISAGGSAVIAISDDGPANGETARVLDGEGNLLGTGRMEINSPLKIYSAQGTIQSVDAQTEEKVSAGAALFTLTSAGSASYESLLNQRAQYEDVLITLLKYAQNNTIPADFSGTISAVALTAGSGTEEGLGDILGGSGLNLPISYEKEKGGARGALKRFAAENNTRPLADPVIAVSGDIPVLISAPATGGTPQNTIAESTAYMGTISWTPAAVLFSPSTAYSATVKLTAKAGFYFAEDAQPLVPGADVTNVIISAEPEGNTLVFTAAFPATQSLDDIGGGNTGGGLGIDIGSILGEYQLPVDDYLSGIGESFSFSTGSIGGLDGLLGSSGGSTLSSLWRNAFTMLAGEPRSITINVDELEILNVAVGQDAIIELDAIPDEEFSATVTKVLAVGNAQSGVTTYPVTLHISDDDTSRLMEGMNATATVITSTTSDIPVIPLTALQEEGREKYVFVEKTLTEQEIKDGVLGERRVVTTGVSDGEFVEILSGLSDGEIVVYQEVTHVRTIEEYMMDAMGGAPSEEE